MRVQIVSFHCILKNQLGQFISSSFNHDVVTTPGPESLDTLPGFIAGLAGLKEGERKLISVKADQAYGFYDQSLLIHVARSEIQKGKKLKTGDAVRANLTDDQKIRSYRVVDANGPDLLLDGNHPLAGQDLVFDVQVTSSREENEQEDDQPSLPFLN